MANPYTGLTYPELQERRAYLLDVLNGKKMKQFGGQGSNFGREIPTLKEARLDLQLVTDALTALGSDTQVVSRTIGVHSSGQR